MHLPGEDYDKFIEIMQMVHNTCSTKALNGKSVIIQLFPHLVPAADTVFVKRGAALM